jgi:hypothetical protein
MQPKTIAPAIVAVVVVALFVHTRVTRGRVLLVVRDRRQKIRWMVNVLLLALAVLFYATASRRPHGDAGWVGSLALLLLTLSDFGVDFFGRPPAGRCTFHQNGVLVFDGRRPQFTRWEDIERYEWQGETLMFHLTPGGLAHVGALISVDVPTEHRGDVLGIIAAHARG